MGVAMGVPVVIVVAVAVRVLVAVPGAHHEWTVVHGPQAAAADAGQHEGR